MKPRWRYVRSEGGHAVRSRGVRSFMLTSVIATTLCLFAGSASATQFYQPENVTPPALSGSFVAGQTLTTTDGIWQGTQPITVSHSWERCGVTNLIPSGSFESDASGWAATSNYAISSSGGTLVRTTEQAYAGSRSLKDSTAGLNFGEGVAYTVPSGAFQIGTRYRFYFYVYAPSDYDGIVETVMVKFFDSSGNYFATGGESPQSFLDFTLHPRWQKITVAFTPPSGTASIQLQVERNFRVQSKKPYVMYLDEAWLDGCSRISDATNSSYTLTEADVGSRVDADVSATNVDGPTTYTIEYPNFSDPVESGIPDTDQSPDTGDDTPFNPAAPQPMSPSGPVPPGSYSTDLWPADATGTTDGLYVVSSTASGTTAVTGAVDNSSTGAAVPNVSVTLACASGCGASVTTTTDSQGSFAFINMPAGIYGLTADAAGYGTYSVTNDPYAPDTPYETTLSLASAAQSYDMANAAGTIADNTNVDASLPGTSYSQRRVPPSVRVEMLNTYPRSAGSLFCQTSGGPSDPPVVNYRLPFYVIHVVFPEVGSLGYNQTAMKAFMALVQNFAWFHKTKGGTYDVTNASNISQCFEPAEKVNIPVWNSWLQSVLPTRLADGSGYLRETPYASGTTTACSDPAEPAHGGKASQLGLRTHSTDSSCLISDWQALAAYYYPADWAVYDSSAPSPFAPLTPPTPTGSANVSGGSITFAFSSTVFGQNVAWRFYLQRLTPTGWRTFRKPGWNSATRTVVNSYVFTPISSDCVRYRVKAVNPVGASLAHAYTAPGYGLSPSGQCALS